MKLRPLSGRHVHGVGQHATDEAKLPRQSAHVCRSRTVAQISPLARQQQLHGDCGVVRVDRCRTELVSLVQCGEIEKKLPNSSDSLLGKNILDPISAPAISECLNLQSCGQTVPPQTRTCSGQTAPEAAKVSMPRRSRNSSTSQTIWDSLQISDITKWRAGSKSWCGRRSQQMPTAGAYLSVSLNRGETRAWKQFKTLYDIEPPGPKRGRENEGG